nr:uncharacterized protein LOC109165835 [Ipomoea batatas]
MDSRRRKRGEGTPKYEFTEASNIGSVIEEHNVDSNTNGNDDEDYEDEVLEEFYDSDYGLVEGKKGDREFDKYVDMIVEYGGVQKNLVADHGVEGDEVDNDGVEGASQSFFMTQILMESGAKLDLLSSNTLLPALKADSDATVEAGHAKISFAIFDKIGNFVSFPFQNVNEPVSEPVNEAVREKVNEPMNEPVADVIAVNTQPEMDFDEIDLYVQLPILELVKEPVRPTRPKIPFIRKKTAVVKALGLKKPIAIVLRKKPFTRSSA